MLTDMFTFLEKNNQQNCLFIQIIVNSFPLTGQICSVQHLKSNQWHYVVKSKNHFCQIILRFYFSFTDMMVYVKHKFVIGIWT